jgi:predicted Fe-S protein YdhL (DUF1289 family)
MPDFSPISIAGGIEDEDPVTSPCVSICTVDRALGLCIGCLRTLQEIGSWRAMTLDQKRATVLACEERAKTMTPRGRDGQPLPPRS